MRHDAHYVEELSQHRPAQIGRMIPVDKLDPNPEQPRTEFGDLTELTASIAEKGVLEPLLVKPNRLTGRWMIIAGERRWRSAQRAGLKEVPCVEMEVDAGTVAEIALIENLQRKDLTVWEEADGLAALAEKFGYTHDQIAHKISKSRTTVTELLAISGLPEEVRTKCRQAKITSKSTLLEIARQFDEPAMFDYLDRVGSGKEMRRQSEKQGPKKTRSNNETADPAYQANSKAFLYSSPKQDFTIELRFNKEGFTRADILKALKHAFDNVKNNNI